MEEGILSQKTFSFDFFCIPLSYGIRPSCEARVRSWLRWSRVYRISIMIRS